MDVYHQILDALYKVTGGNDKLLVDLVELIKKEGFGGAREDILDVLNTEGWITEAAGPEKARITSWGVAEVRRARERAGKGAADAKGAAAAAKKAAGIARELADLLESSGESAPAEELRSRLLALTDAMNRLRE
jgi:hypothetical protein